MLYIGYKIFIKNEKKNQSFPLSLPDIRFIKLKEVETRLIENTKKKIAIFFFLNIKTNKIYIKANVKFVLY